MIPNNIKLYVYIYVIHGNYFLTDSIHFPINTAMPWGWGVVLWRSEIQPEMSGL